MPFQSNQLTLPVQGPSLTWSDRPHLVLVLHFPGPSPMRSLTCRTSRVNLNHGLMEEVAGSWKNLSWKSRNDPCCFESPPSDDQSTTPPPMAEACGFTRCGTLQLSADLSCSAEKPSTTTGLLQTMAENKTKRDTLSSSLPSILGVFDKHFNHRLRPKTGGSASLSAETEVASDRDLYRTRHSGVPGLG